MPKNLDFLAGGLAFAAEGFIFHEHLHGRNHMDVQLHTYLVYIIVMCFVSIIFELVLINNVIPALARATFTLLQGTWFFQVLTLSMSRNRKWHCHLCLGWIHTVSSARISGLETRWSHRNDDGYRDCNFAFGGHFNVWSNHWNGYLSCKRTAIDFH